MVRFFTFLFTLFTLNSFAFAGLFLVGNNVFAEGEPIGGDPSVIIVEPDPDAGGGDCEMSVTCGGNICIVLNARSLLFLLDCEKKCDRTCTKIKPW
ncbi:MAG: hypothetical protein ACOCVN_02115 [bacterium]